MPGLHQRGQGGESAAGHIPGGGQGQEVGPVGQIREEVQVRAEAPQQILE